MARGRQSSLGIVLAPEERQTLERWQRSTTIAVGLARRGKIILLLAAGSPHLQWRRPSACNAPWSATGPSGFSPSG